jgi:hypothetical protein
MLITFILKITYNIKLKTRDLKWFLTRALAIEAAVPRPHIMGEIQGNHKRKICLLPVRESNTQPQDYGG